MSKPQIHSVVMPLSLQSSKNTDYSTVHRAEVETIGRPMSTFRRFVLHRFQKIIAVCEFTRSQALKAGAKDDRTSVINNSCDERIFSKGDKLATRKHHNLDANKSIILFVGNVLFFQLHLIGYK